MEKKFKTHVIIISCRILLIALVLFAEQIQAQSSATRDKIDQLNEQSAQT